MKIQLPQRPSDGHKGTFGRVTVVGGSPGMSGAACLAGAAALRSGAGLVTVAVPQSIQSIVAAFEPSYMTVALSCDGDGQLSADVAGDVPGLIDGQDVIAAGPGLGQEPASEELVRALIGQVSIPLILDADALNCVAAKQLSLSRDAPTIVTPHPGEFLRLTGYSTEVIGSGRQTLAKDFAAQTGAVVVLKGKGTVVSDGTHTYVNSTGNSGMATGGSGDVLTGIIAALCGQGLPAYDAAVAGVYAHGLAGDLYAAELSPRSLIASDLIKWLPRAWARIDE
ncbi:MAG: NAD(P)H-hydrate dehydratase [Fuerstiella sp.]|nr:NAD(P)H-hydrate dehydratase [Fuerstiella sp.]